MSKRSSQPVDFGVSRRIFMKSGALALATIGLNPSFLRRTVFAQDLVKGAALNGNSKGKVLIVLFQRGAADALNVVVPHGEKNYYKMRPTIAVPRPISGAANTAIDLDVQATLGRRHSRARARGRQSEQHALAFRRAGLHGKRDTRQQGDTWRLAQSLPRRTRHLRRMPHRWSHGRVP